ncbi:hypothetical protein TNCV_104501 [Trichonephila clavipes]|nr:hypothetical protein TNCV_104501 [Trichonephila clavipes]
MTTMMIVFDTTPDDSIDVVGSKTVVLKAAFRPVKQLSYLAWDLCILSFQSLLFLDKFLVAIITASIFEQLCLCNAVDDDLLLGRQLEVAMRSRELTNKNFVSKVTVLRRN